MAELIFGWRHKVLVLTLLLFGYLGAAVQQVRHTRKVYMVAAAMAFSLLIVPALLPFDRVATFRLSFGFSGPEIDT